MAGYRNILALDTALQGVCVGVCADGKRFARSETMDSGQAERLMPLVQEVMAEAGLKFPDLHAIVTTTGPGAFTGLRIGLSAARGLGLAAGVPVFGLTTLQAFALQYGAEKKPACDIGVIIETKRRDFYFQIFSKDGETIGDAGAFAGEEIVRQADGRRMVLLGNAVERFRAETGGVNAAVYEQDYMLPDAGFMALHFYEKEGRGGYYSSPASPLYLREADVTAPKRPSRPAVAKLLK